MIRRTITSPINARPSSLADRRMSKYVRIAISATIASANQNQRMWTPCWANFRFVKYANPPASDASNTEYAATDANAKPMPSSRPRPWLTKE